MYGSPVGSILVTSDSQVISVDIVKGESVRVFNVHILSGGGGGAVVSLRNGTTVAGTIYITETGTASTGKTFDYGVQGHLFPGGCFVDVDANTTSVLISCRKELA